MLSKLYLLPLLLISTIACSDTIKSYPAACFSPHDHCDQVLINFINSAKKSIDIAIFDLSHKGIADAIINASKKVPLRIVADKKQAHKHHSLINHLLSNGVQIKLRNKGSCMHNKFAIVDGSFLETGSFNYSKNASRSNDENQVYIYDSKIVSEFQKEFEELWN